MFKKNTIELLFPSILLLVLDAFYYNIVGEIAESRHLDYSFLINLNLDHKIPFIPQLIFVYWFAWMYPFCIVLFFVVTQLETVKIRLIFLMVFMMFFINYLVWVLFPCSDYSIRVPIQLLMQEPTDYWNKLVAMTYAVSSNWNTLPSMHVSMPWLMFRVVKIYRPAFFIVPMMITSLITLSVLAIKIHYILDAVAAIVLVEIILYLMVKKQWVHRILNGPLKDMLVTYLILAFILLLTPWTIGLLE